MTAFNKFNVFSADLLAGKHNFSSHIFKMLLSNVAPNAANTVRADITQIANGNGYTTGGNTVTVTRSDAGGVAKASGASLLVTATGPLGPLQYAILCNDTASGGPLVCWWQMNAAETLGNTDTLTFIFDAANGIFTLS